MYKLTREQRKTLYTRLLLRITIAIVILLLLFLCMPILFSMLAPFFFAYLMAMILSPIVNIIYEKFSLSRKITALFLVFFMFTGLAGLIIGFFYSIVNEAISLSANFQSVWGSIETAVELTNSKIQWLLDFMPSETNQIIDNMMENIYQWFQSLSGNLLNFIVSASAGITTSIGNVIMSGVVFIIAAYFITAEYHKIDSSLKRFFNEEIYDYYFSVKEIFASILGNYLKAQLMLSLLAFIVMLIALLILGQSYAFLIALFLGFIDLLPIVGTSAILVPWGIIELSTGYGFKGSFLLILAGAFFILRKIVEPKIVGSQTGLHPLAALMSVFFGYKLAGVLGAVFGPIITMALVMIYKARFFGGTIKDIKAAIMDLTSILQSKL